MLYRVVADNIDILDFAYPDLVLLSPNVEMELDSAGSFEFTVPPTHRYYGMFDMASIMSMTVEVYEDQVLHFFGRPVELHLDFYKNKKVYCEGALAYFNDSVQRKKEYDEGTYLSDFLQDVIDNHNSMVPENRQFTLNTMTVPDHTLYRKIDYEQTSDVLKSKILDAEEGHFFLERLDGVNYISFLRDDVMPYSCNQHVTFGENLLNFTYSFDGKDFATCVMPIGSIISENEGGTGDPLTIESVNSGSDILVGNSAANFGQIVKVQHYSDIKDAHELLSEAQKYLTKVQYNATLIECSTLDLHSLDNTKVLFRIGQTVHCVSYPHAIEIDLPVSKLSLQLDSAEKQITLGRIPKKTLSRFYKEITDRSSDDYGDYDYGGDGWTIVPPDTDGGNPTMKTMPIGFVVTHMPNKTSYGNNETIDYTGLVCYAVSSFDPVTFFTDSTYTTGLIPYGEIQKPLTVMKTADALKTSSVKALLRWPNPYKPSQIFEQYITLTNSVKKAQEDAAEAEHGGKYPDHIEAFVTKLGGVDPQVYKAGDRIHLNGVKVYAFWPDGSRYNANGYNDGYIPITEIAYSPKIAHSDSGIHGMKYDGELDTGSYEQPILVGTTVSSSQGTNGWSGVATADCLTCLMQSGGYPVCIAASATSGKSMVRHSTPNTSGIGNESTTVIPISNTFTHDGKTVYWGGANNNSVLPYDSSNPTSFISGPVYMNGIAGRYSPGAIAWIMIYGSEEETEGSSDITVSWKRPEDGQELTTTYPIKIKPSKSAGGQGGR